MQPQLSIVIPVYNVAEYIKKCITSCYTQNIDANQYEIILVNDGSTDNSLEICEELKLDYPDLKIISQKNKGLSGARNTGLKNATGEFVWFVDSDDWITEDCLVSILQKLQADLDILWIGHDVWHNGQSTKKYIPNNTTNMISGEELFSDHLHNMFYIWKFIYRRNFLIDHNLTFLEGILYEDLEFTPRALLKAKKCMTHNEICYHYLVRSGSIANNIKEKNISHRFFILNKLEDLFKNETISNRYKGALSNVIVSTVVGTTNLASRAGHKIPTDGLRIFERIKSNKFHNKNKTLKLKLITLSPSLYNSLFSFFYKAFKGISNK